MFSRLTNIIHQRQNNRAENNISKNGLEEKNNILISKGFNNPKDNYKALKQTNGDINMALQVLTQRSQIKESKSQIKQEKKGMIKHMLESRQQIKTQNKMIKYQVKLQKLQPTVEQYMLRDKLNQITKMGFDNQVKVIKVLLKNSGDLNRSLEFIQRKSQWNNKKFKLAGIKGYEEYSQAQTSVQMGQQPSPMYPQQNQQGNYNYPPPPPPPADSDFSFPSQQPVYPNYNQYPPQQYNPYQQQMNPGFNQYPPMNNQYPQMSNQYDTPYYEQGYTQNPSMIQQSNQKQSNLQQTQVQSSQIHIIQTQSVIIPSSMVETQNQKERKSLKQPTNEFEIPEGMDVDAYQQMIVGKKEEIQNQKNSNFPQEAFNIKDEDVETYIKKNQFLISQGFLKAERNVEALLTCNGDEYKALQLLQQKQQQKQKKGKYTNNNTKQNYDSSSSSSLSDD